MQNNVIQFGNQSSEILKNTATLHYSFESFVVEEREETFVYDVGSFLAAGKQ